MPHRRERRSAGLACALRLALLALLVAPVTGQVDSVPRQGDAVDSAQARAAAELRSAHDATDEGLAFVEVSADRDTYYLHQPIRLRVSIGIEEEFLRHRAIQPFRRRLDLPVRLVAPWAGGVAGALVHQLAPARKTPQTETRASLAFGEDVGHASRTEDRWIDERSFRVFELETALLPTATGELHVPAPLLRLAWATSFRESLLSERVPVDRVDGFVTGKALALSILPLPETGRPFDFSGAVGDLSLRAHVPTPEIDAGATLKLELTLAGEGNLHSFEAPDWRELGAFRVLGLLDEKTASARVFTLDLAPMDEQAWQVPEIPLVIFHPGPPAGYRTLRTESIDVILHAEPGLDPAPEVREPAQSTEPEHATDEDSTGTWHPLVWIAPGALVAVAWLLVRRRD